jgi:hypothetical protein
MPDASLVLMESPPTTVEGECEETGDVSPTPCGASLELTFTRMSWEVERLSAPVRSAIMAGFAAARVESELMLDCGLAPRDRLAAAKQLRSGFVELCRLVGDRRNGTPRAPARGHDAGLPEGTETVPDALDALYAVDD